MKNLRNKTKHTLPFTHPSENELSHGAVTQSKELLKHSVVEQLAMIGTRLAIPRARSSEAQRMTSDGTTREQSPKSCLARLCDKLVVQGQKSQKWRRRSAGDARSVDDMKYPTVSHDSEPTAPPVSKMFRTKAGLVQFPDDGPCTRRVPTTNGRAVIKYFRKETR